MIMPDINRLYAELEKDFIAYLRHAKAQGDSMEEIAQALREGAELSVSLEGKWLHIHAVFPESGDSTN